MRFGALPFGISMCFRCLLAHFRHFFAMGQDDDIAKALEQASLPESVQAFCNFTFTCIAHAPLHAQAAVFTYGREDLIPDMFMSLVRRLKEAYPQQLETFTYYLERHIEVDGDHHSQLAIQMVNELCGNDPDKLEEATEFAIQSLQMRKQLWDGIVANLN